MQNGAWRVIDCTNLEGRLKYARGRLLVSQYETGETSEIPLAQIAVLLVGQRSNCSTALLYELAQYGVSVLICDWRGIPVSALHSWCDTPTIVTQRHRAQVSMSLPRQKNAWKKIIQAKIYGQAHCLELIGDEQAGTLFELAKQVRSGDISNAEGTAARFYWSRVFESGFRRKPGSGIGKNSLLDYAYAVLRGHVIRAIITAGLSPVFGVSHHNRSNYYCLADDLIEPYRPAIDHEVYQLPETATLEDPLVKKHLVNATNLQFAQSGSTIPSSLTEFAQQFGLYCEGRIKSLSVPRFGEFNEER
ncbi:subtype II CRISPR-associated endonuclease Cas1 [Bifidobacterium dolichotidis]|uniref:CRISPR-associated endonuclease Cas1 n=1 Tax=Bifidobacterium dolichotidis TaxID=2306976 RepID=A0A430FRY5_9BIFI|nr:type II CRISPR-associated endonuclease Cas1 [Bifidobacterium dolichotidis]RSX55613.1 subtype II CRISPR-associated endonuclease Cas1 [Bifidobacterium dolichotidis]